MLLEIKELTKEYKRNEKTFPAVDKVNLSISPRDFISITGRSGSGKSTLLNMIAGLLKPTSGAVAFSGRDIFTLNDKDISFLRNAKIGYVPQGQTLLPNLSVLDNVCLPFYLSRREGGVIEKALSLLEQAGIPYLARIYPRQLSGGELRRVSIARALINDPQLLIADEPTADLDADTTVEIMKLFSRIARNGTAILMVTHDRDAEAYCNRSYSMQSGTLTAS